MAPAKGLLEARHDLAPPTPYGRPRVRAGVPDRPVRPAAGRARELKRSGWPPSREESRRPPRRRTTCQRHGLRPVGSTGATGVCPGQGSSHQIGAAMDQLQITRVGRNRPMTTTMDQPEASQATGQEAIRRFEVPLASQAALDDLRRRILATRWPDRETDPSQGVNLDTIQALATYWATDYDWRAFEERFAALPHYVTEIDGVDIHFIHVRSKHADALPLIVTHGWPGSTVEQLKLIGAFTDPTAHGASADDAFHLVIPSLPGHGFSGKPTETGWDPIRIARAWVELMRSPRLRPICRPGRRLGQRGHGAAGAPEARWPARHPHEHAGDRPAGRLEGARERRSQAGWPLGRRGQGLRDPQALLRDRRRLRQRDGQSAADAVRNRRLAGGPRGLDARPRRAQLSS